MLFLTRAETVCKINYGFSFGLFYVGNIEGKRYRGAKCEVQIRPCWSWNDSAGDVQKARRAAHEVSCGTAAQQGEFKPLWEKTWTGDAIPQASAWVIQQQQQKPPVESKLASAGKSTPRGALSSGARADIPLTLQTRKGRHLHCPAHTGVPGGYSTVCQIG